MDFDPLPLDIPPGIVKSRSPLDVRGRYIDCDKVRFESGRPRKMGGWSQLTSDVLGAPGRGSYAWIDLNGEPLIAFGTYEKAFVYYGGVLEDITPAAFSPGSLDYDTSSVDWGLGDWGEGPWGGVGLSSIGPANPLTWSFAAYGEDLLLMPRWGGLYIWDRSAAPGIATPVTNAPTIGLGVLVSQESRHVVVYGADGDGVLVKWADQETTTSWTPTATGTAGDKRADDGNAVMGHIHTRGGTLLNTGGSAHFLSYIGRPYAFGVKKVAENCGMIAPLAGVDLNGTAYWMGNDGFYLFDGGVRRLECDVNDYVFGRMNKPQRFKICAGINARYGEVWWHYPTEDGGLENSDYVIYNAREACWYIGTMGRSAWVEDHDVSPHPISVDDEGTIFTQETGSNDGSSAMPYYIETGEIDMVDGKAFSHIRQVIPDFLEMAGDHSFTLTTRKRPRDPNPRTRGPYALSTLTDKKSIRVRSNSFRFKLAGDGINMDFKGGLFRLRIKQRGQR